MKKILFALLFITMAFSQIDNTIAGWYNEHYYVPGGNVYSEGLIVVDEGTLATESLDQVDFSSHTAWIVTNDFDAGFTGQKAVYLWTAQQTSTLKQEFGSMIVTCESSQWYVFTYTVAVTTPFNGDGAATITTVAASAVALDLSVGTHTVYFYTAVMPADFVISVVSGSDTEGTWTIDDVTLREITGGDLYVYGNILGYGTLGMVTGTTINEFSTDGTLAGDSDDAIPTEKAVKAYADAIGAAVHDPVTLGTANGLGLSTQVLSLVLSSASVTGALSSTDWNTFNDKVTDDDDGVDGVYGSGWDSDTDSPEKDDIYDYLHLIDTDDDGDVDNIDATALAAAETDPNALLTAGTDNVTDLHLDFGTGGNQISAVDIPIADGGGIIAGTEVETALQENRTAIDLNTSKNTNVPTELALAAPTATTVPINSDGSSPDITLIEATTSTAGLLGADKWDEIVANTSLFDVTPGTATASKALVVDSNKDIDLDTGDFTAAEITATGDFRTQGYIRRATILFQDDFDFWSHIGYENAWNIEALTSAAGLNDITSNVSHITLTADSEEAGEKVGTRSNYAMVNRTRKNRTEFQFELSQTANTYYYMGWNDDDANNMVAAEDKYVIVYYEVDTDTDWQIKVGDGTDEEVINTEVLVTTDVTVIEIWTEIDGTVHLVIDGVTINVSTLTNKMATDAHYLIVGQVMTTEGTAVTAQIGYVENEKFKAH